jgi:hypothetical protein
VYLVSVAIITLTNRLTYILWGTQNDTEITDIHGAPDPRPNARVLDSREFVETARRAVSTMHRLV